MKSIPIAKLVFNYDLYIRNNLDAHNIRTMVEAMMAGVELPPIVIDQNSHEVVDGFHRGTAKKRVGGPEATIMCIEKSYKNEGERQLDAIRYNAPHGAKLDPWDRVRCAMLGKQCGLKLGQVADALNMPEKTLEELVSRRSAKEKLNGKKRDVILKHPNEHLRGQQISPKQAKGNEKSGGNSQLFYVNQVINSLEAELFDFNNEDLVQRTKHLAKLINETL